MLLDPYAKGIGRDVVWDDSLFPYDINSHSPDKDLIMSTLYVLSNIIFLFLFIIIF